MSSISRYDRNKATERQGSGRFPTFISQFSYFTTGAFAGASALPIDLLWNRFSTSRPNAYPRPLRAIAIPAVYRGGVRFWAFDHARYRLRSDFSLTPWLVGGLSGAVGGFAEICVQSALKRNIPSVIRLINQSGKLFCCFGSYTYLSTTLSPEQLPPKPFWKCWCMGAMAGGMGSGIVAWFEGLRGRELWRGAVPKGAVGVGTVIAVQVTTCDGMIRWIDRGTYVD